MAGPETCSPGNFLDFYVPWRILAAQAVHISTFAIGILTSTGLQG